MTRARTDGGRRIDVSLAQRFERRLEGLVGGAFARVFKGQVEPVEIGTALQREASDKRNVMGNGQVLCPNRYRVTLSPSDHDRLAPWEVQLTSSLAELVQEYLDENRWSTIGDIEVYLALDEPLHTGVFGVASRMEAQAPPRRRPHDSAGAALPRRLCTGSGDATRSGDATGSHDATGSYDATATATVRSLGRRRPDQSALRAASRQQRRRPWHRRGPAAARPGHLAASPRHPVRR
jgi:hypothetical protein